MAVTLAQLQADLGDVYTNLTNGTTAASAILTKANTTISDITGTTTNYDIAIRNTADYFIVNQMLGSRDGVSVGVEGVSIGEKRLVEMRNAFLEQSMNSLKVAGFSVNGARVRIEQVNG